MPSEAHRSVSELREGGLTAVKTVYLLKSISDPTKRYIGLTKNIRRRLEEHNAGKSPYSAKFAPWEVVVSVDFVADEKAMLFETYLKSGSGHAFAEKHLW